VRTAFLGTSDFAATVLRRLAGSPHCPVLVVTPPDRRKGRGRRSGPPPAAALSRELEIELLQTDDVNDDASRERIGAAAPEALAVCAFGQLIRQPLLSEPLLNVHPSLLPRWRGAAPIERAIMAGDAVTGVSIMRLTAGLDSGPIALQEELPIAPDDDFASLAERLAALGGELLVGALDLQARAALELREQDEDGVVYAEKIDPAERRLDPGRPAPELARRVRALTPHVGAYLALAGGERLGVRRARAVESELAAGDVRVADGDLAIGCAEGALRLEVVQPAGGKAMPVDAYLRGHPPPSLA
jgi:methionyl-tRNA formyltransferase